MTLARQMYPSKTPYFMRHFESASSKPYGYLLVDLTPTTPEYLRLRANALEELHKEVPEDNSHCVINSPIQQASFNEPITLTQTKPNLLRMGSESSPYENHACNYSLCRNRGSCFSKPCTGINHEANLKRFQYKQLD